MKSDINTIFVNRNRHAEHTDGRFEIKRHERDDNGKKQEFDKDETAFDTDDDMRVSVGALIVFLQNFLKNEQPENIPASDEAPQNFLDDNTTPAEQSFSGQDSKHSSVLGGAQKTPMQVSNQKSKQHARAASAYQTRARGGTSSAQLSDIGGKQTGADLLESADIRAIHMLLEDLEILLSGGVEELALEPAGSFVQSLVNSAEKARLYL